jgi:hypothetical protein
VNTVTCPCGSRFEARSPRAVYCSAKCRKRGNRAGVSAVPTRSPKVAPLPVPDQAEVPSVTGAVIADLAAANALGSPAGLAAVRLAQLIDSVTPMAGSSAAAWVREMRAALDDAKREAPTQEQDPIDELERKRASRGA